MFREREENWKCCNIPLNKATASIFSSSSSQDLFRRYKKVPFFDSEIIIDSGSLDLGLLFLVFFWFFLEVFGD